MNKFWVCLFLFLVHLGTESQAQNVEWITQAGGLKYDAGMDISLDSDQNSLVVGVFSDTLQLAGNELIAAGGTDLFIAKYNTSGELVWVEQAGGNASDEAYGVGTDAAGNVYLTGYFRDTIDFAGNQLFAAGSFDDDVFIAKYTPDGTFAWARQMGGAGSDIAYDIEVDAEGNSYIVGRFADRFTAPVSDNSTPFTFLAKGTFDIFVAKYDADGQRLWIRQYGGEGYDSAQAIALDANDNYYLTGFFNGTTQFDSQSLLSNGDFDAFVAKFDETGMNLWANHIGGAYSDLGTSIDIDNSGNAYISGSFEDTAFIEGNTIEAVESSDVFISKFHADGSFAWIRQGGGEEADIGLGIATDSNGNSHVTGVFSEIFIVGEDTLATNPSNNGAIFLLQYNTDGDLQWKTNTIGNSYDEATAIAIDADQNCYLTGSFSENLEIGGETINSNGISDLFVAKIEGMTTDLNNSVHSNVGFQLYPNPVSHQLFIEFESENADLFLLQLVDYSGRLIYEEWMENKRGVNRSTLDTSRFAKGIYLLKMRSNQFTISEKLVIR